jgi:hypothetical protein
MNAPVVSWAGPLERARQALDRASELFERKDFDGGMEEMATMQNHVNLAVLFIQTHHPEGK